MTNDVLLTEAIPTIVVARLLSLSLFQVFALVAAKKLTPFWDQPEGSPEGSWRFARAEVVAYRDAQEESF